jgi:signal peptidase II
MVAIVVLSGAVLAVDQVTKTLALHRLSSGPVHLFGPFSLALAFNTGVAFSLFHGYGVPILLAVLALVVVVAYFGRGAPSLPAAIGVGLVLGGAAGNLSDRIFRSGGAVVDFIHTGFWPTFNVADSAIVGGCALLALGFERRGRARRKGPSPEGDGTRTAEGDTA